MQPDGSLFITEYEVDGEMRPYDSSDHVLLCFNDDGEPQYIPDHLQRAMPRLILMHIFCLILKLYADVLESVNKKSYFHNILRMMTVPAYQLAIM